MNLTLVVPFINRPELSQRAIQNALELKTLEDTEVIAYSDGAENPGDHLPMPNNLGLISDLTRQNHGVLETFRYNIELEIEFLEGSDIIVFTHNDLLIHEKGWDERILIEFEARPQLGMAGFVGGVGVGPDGGRISTQSNMLGKEWGACECHERIGEHHGEIMPGFCYAATLDGCCTIFRRECFEELIEKTDCFDDRRPLNHWYDRNIPLYAIKLGWQVGIIGVGFDHFSANTGAGTESYHKSVREWIARNNIQGDSHLDHLCYLEGERQFKEEWAEHLPCIADRNGNYSWTREP